MKDEQNLKKGLVLFTQRFSIHDGPGIRTTVFLKGCNLHCAWCHNPESIEHQPELVYVEQNCIHCGRCGIDFGSASFQIEQRTGIALATFGWEMIERCPTGALVGYGKWKSADELVREIKRDERFYRTSGGGATVSGGEPMEQFEWTKQLLQTLKHQGIHTAMETNGTAPLERYMELLPYTDLFLLDYKLSDEVRSRKLTGDSGKATLNTLEMLQQKEANVILRCPIVPGLNDGEEHLRAIAMLTKKYPNLLGYELMPYHSFGVSKAKRLRRKQKEYRIPSKQEVASWESTIRMHGGRNYGEGKQYE